MSAVVSGNPAASIFKEEGRGEMETETSCYSRIFPSTFSRAGIIQRRCPDY
jgi:hypothetical protein